MAARPVPPPPPGLRAQKRRVPWRTILNLLMAGLGILCTVGLVRDAYAMGRGFWAMALAFSATLALLVIPRPGPATDAGK